MFILKILIDHYPLVCAMILVIIAGALIVLTKNSTRHHHDWSHPNVELVDSKLPMSSRIFIAIVLLTSLLLCIKYFMDQP